MNMRAKWSSSGAPPLRPSPLSCTATTRGRGPLLQGNGVIYCRYSCQTLGGTVGTLERVLPLRTLGKQIRVHRSLRYKAPGRGQHTGVSLKASSHSYTRFSSSSNVLVDFLSPPPFGLVLRKDTIPHNPMLRQLASV